MGRFGNDVSVVWFGHAEVEPVIDAEYIGVTDCRGDLHASYKDKVLRGVRMEVLVVL